jgi:hypothetical protein
MHQEGSKEINKPAGSRPLYLKKDSDNREQHQRVELRTAIIPGKWRNSQENLI